MNHWHGKTWYAYGTSMTSIAQGKYVPKKTVPVTYADELCLYVLYVTNEAGERVRPEFFNNAYLDSAFLQVGMGAFGPEFDHPFG